MSKKVTKEAKGQAKLKELTAALKAAEKDLSKAQRAYDKIAAAHAKQYEKLQPKAAPLTQPASVVKEASQ